MSDGRGGFLSRWSRLKREARREPEPETKSPTEVEPDALEAEADANPKLPPIEELTVDSDFSQFLRKGVPPDLRKAALRKLWVSDPAILNYKTLADYDWDFNAPGYGALWPTDDVEKLVSQILKPFDQPTVTAEPAVESAPSSAERDEALAVAPAEEPAGLEPLDPDPEAVPFDPISVAAPETVPPSARAEAPTDLPDRPRPRHGGAIPV